MRFRVGKKGLSTLAAAVAVAGIALPVQGQWFSSPVDAAHRSAPAKTVTITIQNFAFSPATVTVKLGTVVVWVNKDAAPHTSTFPASKLSANAMTWDSGPLSQGQTFTLTTTARGTYRYDCTIHDMEAVLRVR